MFSHRKTAIVTGASSGIGQHSAIALSNAGWNVVLTARREEALRESVKLCAHPENTLVIAGDVTSEDFVKELFAKAVENFGRLDLLFNNAGTNAPQVPIEELSLDTFQRVINVNLIGPFLCTREAFKVFKNQAPPGGRIINNGSLSAHVPRPFSCPYTASKHAISGLTKSTSLDGRPFNISCTQIDIGNAQTDMAARLSKGTLQPDGRVIPEAMMDVQHVADAIIHIAGLPNDVTVLEMNIMPTHAPFIGRG
ncbi:NAD(P)-binding protein [Guyanagaster necrorhizus]|uniref:NAD(P)-binding protein n=1 Tax=Guyanagaster necrorhizus TaxID=856835 RepID=A0A9P7VL68_9AGAR|nr:NAD(P)-binding protein [Guyanagaster necrorhizus MCA 3950]KAG7443161.1 NAD(P)-binding protein [Guyanagaster necrorhizus MCA 3950]